MNAPSLPLAQSARRARPSLEALEDRLAPATFTVVNMDDAGTGSLRQAITRANATPGADLITFNIPGAPAPTIGLLSALPAITDRVTIAGQTQTGFAGTPIIELNGTSAGSGQHGLVIRSGGSGSVVRSLAINRFDGNGIRIRSDGCRVAGCFIGTDMVGVNPLANNLGGVFIGAGSTSNVIGGVTASARNIISGNINYGVWIEGASTFSNAVLGNFIGTDVTGTIDLGNVGPGVGILFGASGNAVGGTTPGTGNVISGNEHGVMIHGVGTTANRIQGNFIGTDGAGTADLGNNLNGVRIRRGASGNVVGGSSTAARNVISGNDLNGVEITSTGTTGNLVRGNFIGIDSTGTVALGNTLAGISLGVFFGGAAGNVIGGTMAGARNVISGNGTSGVELIGTGVTGNQILGNFIGTDPDGTVAIGNTGNGVAILGGATANVIGGTVAAARNVISGNSSDGVTILNEGTTGNQVLGNYIGTDRTGSADLGNANNGLIIGLGAAQNVVGGTSTGARNVISGNDGSGIEIFTATTTGNRIRGNFIGTDKAGTGALGNTDDGVRVSAGNNVIGGRAAGAGNRIAHNGSDGIQVGSGTGTILRNRIHDNADLGIALGFDGVTANDLNDPDTGPNEFQNFPELSLARLTPFGLRIRGSINTETNATLRIEFFSSPAADPSGHGEGRRFLGAVTVETGSGNTAEFSVFLPPTGVQIGHAITATATDEEGNSSEFSLALSVT